MGRDRLVYNGQYGTIEQQARRGVGRVARIDTEEDMHKLRWMSRTEDGAVQKRWDGAGHSRYDLLGRTSAQFPM